MGLVSPGGIGLGSSNGRIRVALAGLSALGLDLRCTVGW